MKNNARTISYNIPIEVHNALTELLARMGLEDVKKHLAINFDGEVFSDAEAEVKANLIFQFYFTSLLPNDAKLHGGKNRYVTLEEINSVIAALNRMEKEGETFK